MRQRLGDRANVLSIVQRSAQEFRGTLRRGIRSAGRTRLAYRDGVPLAVLEAGAVRELTSLDPPAAAQVERAFATRQRRALALR